MFSFVMKVRLLTISNVKMCFNMGVSGNNPLIMVKILLIVILCENEYHND